MSRVDDLPVSTPVAGAIAVGILVLSLPLSGVLSDFHLGLIINIMVLGIFAMSFNLLFGYTGLLSFGHAAYFGIGAYTFGLAVTGQLGFLPPLFESFIPAMILGVLIAGLFAAVFGIFCVQRDDIYFAILTLAFSMMSYEVVYNWNALTGGSDGFSVTVQPIELGGLEFNLVNTSTFYYLAFLLLAISVVILWRIVNSPYGELLIAIRENPRRATMIGVPVKFYQLSSFITAGLFAGLAGTLFAVRTFIVTPGMLHWSMSAEPVLMTLLGGPSAFFGPLVGALLFILLEQVLTNITEYWQFGLGIILVLIVLFAPNGVVGLLRSTTDLPDFNWREYIGDASKVSDISNDGEGSREEES